MSKKELRIGKKLETIIYHMNCFLTVNFNLKEAYPDATVIIFTNEEYEEFLKWQKSYNDSNPKHKKRKVVVVHMDGSKKETILDYCNTIEEVKQIQEKFYRARHFDCLNYLKCYVYENGKWIEEKIDL